MLVDGASSEGSLQLTVVITNEDGGLSWLELDHRAVRCNFKCQAGQKRFIALLINVVIQDGHRDNLAQIGSIEDQDGVNGSEVRGT